MLVEEPQSIAVTVWATFGIHLLVYEQIQGVYRYGGKIILQITILVPTRLMYLFDKTTSDICVFPCTAECNFKHKRLNELLTP